MVILLNGASSSGKSAIARAMQMLAVDKKFLTLGIDTFIKMMPFGMLGFDHFAKEGFFLEYEKNTKEPRVKITTGDFGYKIINASSKICRILAEEEFNIIIDEVLLDQQALIFYVKNLINHPVYFIKVYCDLKILQEREMLRGNRAWGIASEHFYSLHKPEFIYDFEVNSSKASPFELAEQILDFINKNKKPTGFIEMNEKRKL